MIDKMKCIDCGKETSNTIQERCLKCHEEIEDIRFIECPQCGFWEQFPADMARADSQEFAFVELADDNNGVYKCPECKTKTTSTIESVEKGGK